MVAVGPGRSVGWGRGNCPGSSRTPTMKGWTSDDCAPGSWREGRVAHRLH